MHIEAAKRFVAAMQEAIFKAEREGRAELTHADLEFFAQQDDKSRASLQAAIARAQAEGR